MNDKERDVMKCVDARQDDMVAFLQKMVRTNSENPPGDYRPIADVVAEACHTLGMNVQIHSTPEELTTARGLTGPRLCVVGRYGGDAPGPKVMLNGHMDTVPIGNLRDWTVEPLGADIHDGRIRGRGAVDSKGRIAAYWCAVAALIDAGEIPRGEILLVSTCDEETGGEFGAGWMAKEMPDIADYAIVEGYNRPVVRASSGILWLEIEVSGRASHASWPWRGHNAIVDASKIIQRLESLKSELQQHRGDIPGIPHTTMSVGTISGGSKVNVVPDQCSVRVDFRVMPGVTTAEIKGRVQDILDGLAALDAEFSARISVLQEQHPMVTPEDSALVQTTVAAVEEISGERPAIEGEPGGTDARWWYQAGIETVNYGPGSPDGGNFHAADENVGIDELIEAAKVCALTTHRLLRTQ